MFITILGCGRIGRMLALDLVKEGHNVAIIDKSKENLKELGSGFNGVIVEGLGIDEEVLIKAGIEEADVFIGLSAEDSINIMAAQIAKRLFKVKRVIARVYKGELNDFYEQSGIEIIYPSKDAEERIKRSIVHQNAGIIAELTDEKLLLVRITAGKALAHKKIIELDTLNQMKVLHMKRNGVKRIPIPEEVINEGDILVMSIKQEVIGMLERLLV